MYSLIKITTKLILVKPVYATVFRKEIILIWQYNL